MRCALGCGLWRGLGLGCGCGGTAVSNERARAAGAGATDARVTALPSCAPRVTLPAYSPTHTPFHCALRSIGSQIINVLLGLGLPWTLSNLWKLPINITDHANLRVATIIQSACVLLNFCLLLVWAWCSRANKALLTKRKGAVFLVAYAAAIGTYGFYILG